jgi:hypothetical protein
MKVLSYSSPLLACSLPLYTSEYRSLPILILDLVLLSSSTFILSDYAIALEAVMNSIRNGLGMPET